MDYQKAYLLLFNAITNALTAMEQQNFGQSRQILVSAQQQAEELYMESDILPDAPAGK